MQLPDQLAQQIILYLKRQPYEEVAGLIGGIIEASKVEAEQQQHLDKKAK